MTSRSDRGPPASRVITSLTNDRVKLIRSLDMRKARRETGLFVAEGASVLMTARENGWRPQILAHGAEARESRAHRELIDWALREGTEGLEVSHAVLEKLAAKENPQNLMGVFEQRWAALPETKSLAKSALWVALDEIRDPGNLGTIIRTVDAVGADGVILVGNCCDPYQREAVRATMGSLFAVPLVKVERAAFVHWAKTWPGDRIGTHLDATADFRDGGYKGPTLLLMGREGPGMSDEVAAVCNRLVKIPMAGRLDSLNLAVATALMLYEVKRSALKL
ncbi:RNA methyltransferase [Hyphomicrobium sp. CS1BSMeth3]|uniref:TrmH family RNA methyltransferase n=1 Tax=Hyphomicrobium sp. CS1BSMeth3 TaxID=1892844 RepID=UPI0009312201|nr:RNA methyltransferase [Hyphomicrobium sp. CS1BSMeth3]